LILLSYSEIGLKKDNRYYFEKRLLDNIRSKTKEADLKNIINLHKKYLLDYENEDLAISLLQNIFGIHKIRKCKIFDLEDRESFERNLLKDIENKRASRKIKTFGVTTKRINKRYPQTSMDFSKDIGSLIYEYFGDLQVDLKNPDLWVYCEIEKKFLIYYIDEFDGLGGLPVGTGGKALLLLSGGIDSPVAGFLMQKRGVILEVIHFHSPPYTSEQLKIKIEKIAKQLAYFQNNKIKLYFVDIAKYLRLINKYGNRDYNVLHQRRLMMKVAEKIAVEYNLDALITGDNLGQVASQTIKNILAVNSIINKTIIFRPLIAYEKNDIIKLSKKIGIYDISIEPLEDCCTLFVPKHPVTKANVNIIEDFEEKIDFDSIVDEIYNLREEKIVKI